MIDYDSYTVQRMLAYLYVGDYADGQLNGSGPGAAIIGAAAYGTILRFMAECCSSYIWKSDMKYVCVTRRVEGSPAP